MAKRHFWSGFAAGAAAGLGGIWAAGRLGQGGSSRIVRLERSIQIGRPVEEVFDTWSDFSRLPEYSKMIRSVQRFGDRSHWVVEVNGRPCEWDAELTQIIPNESLGWKSVGGMQHTGRINFARLGGDALVHVQMNYVPPMRLLRPMLSGMTGQLEGYIERALREFKNALESEHRSETTGRVEKQSTGTHGHGPEALTRNTNEKYGAPSVPVEYTRPPEAKY